MKSFLLALIAVGAISYAANLALENSGFSTRDMTVGSSVRPG